MFSLLVSNARWSSRNQRQVTSNFCRKPLRWSKNQRRRNNPCSTCHLWKLNESRTQCLSYWTCNRLRVAPCPQSSQIVTGNRQWATVRKDLFKLMISRGLVTVNLKRNPFFRRVVSHRRRHPNLKRANQTLTKETNQDTSHQVFWTSVKAALIMLNDNFSLS